MIRVLLVEDHLMFAELLTLALADDPRFEVIDHGVDGREGVDLAADLQPDLILMDLWMPRMDGLDATVRIRQVAPRAKIVILSGESAGAVLDAAYEAGAAAFVQKDRALSDLKETLLAVVDAGRTLAPCFDIDEPITRGRPVLQPV